MALRYDIGALRSPERMPNGWLRADGYLTRVGVFLYRNPGGDVRRELRLPEEVFKADSLRSFHLVPVTNNHPPELLTAQNTKTYAVGTTAENVAPDGENVRASLMVTDAETIAGIEGGKSQLSCGYTCDMEEAPGVHPMFGPYDVIQRNIKGNHVAIVDVARAGPDARLRLDSLDAVMVEPKPKENIMKITINGVVYEVSDQVEQALTRERADQAEVVTTLKNDLTNARAESEKSKAKLDAANEALATEKKARADATDPKLLNERVNARVALIVQARNVLPADTKLDTLDDHAIKIAVLGKLVPELKLDGRSADYVQARFDIAIEAHEKANPALDSLRRVVLGGNENRNDAGTTGDPDKDKRNAMIAENRKRSNEPLPGAVQK